MPDDKDNQTPPDNGGDNADQSQGGGGDGGAKPWFDGLDPDLKSNPSIQKFKSVGDLGKSYLELQKTLGKDRVVVPTEKSTPEEWKAFFRKAGAPEKEDEYDVGDEDLPEQVRPDAATKEAFRKACLAEGYTKKQFNAAWTFYKNNLSNKLNQEVEGIKKMRGDAETQLRQEWGAAYEGKVDGAQKVINQFFKDKGIRKEFSILANDKGFIKAMADIAEKLGEDVIKGGSRQTLTPQEAQIEYNRMINDTKGDLYNEFDPVLRMAAVEKLAELQRMILAGGGQ